MDSIQLNTSHSCRLGWIHNWKHVAGIQLVVNNWKTKNIQKLVVLWIVWKSTQKLTHTHTHTHNQSHYTRVAWFSVGFWVLQSNWNEFDFSGRISYIWSQTCIVHRKGSGYCRCKQATLRQLFSRNRDMSVLWPLSVGGALRWKSMGKSFRVTIHSWYLWYFVLISCTALKWRTENVVGTMNFEWW